MSDNRRISLRGLLRKATTAKSAIAFFDAYREYLTSGELSEVTSPILVQVDSGEILPTPALEMLQKAVLKHILLKDSEVKETKETTKNYIGRILDEKGEVVMVGEDELTRKADMAQDIDGWIDRRLFEGASSWHGETTHTPTGLVTITLRADAIARIMRKPRGPTCHMKSKTTGKLSFGVKAKESHARFSTG